MLTLWIQTPSNEPLYLPDREFSVMARKCKRCERTRLITVIVIIVGLFTVLFIDRFLT